jgi:hypothetical protein
MSVESIRPTVGDDDLKGIYTSFIDSCNRKVASDESFFRKLFEYFEADGRGISEMVAKADTIKQYIAVAVLNPVQYRVFSLNQAQMSLLTCSNDFAYSQCNIDPDDVIKYYPKKAVDGIYWRKIRIAAQARVNKAFDMHHTYTKHVLEKRCDAATMAALAAAGGLVDEDANIYFSTAASEVGATVDTGAVVGCTNVDELTNVDVGKLIGDTVANLTATTVITNINQNESAQAAAPTAAAAAAASTSSSSKQNAPDSDTSASGSASTVNDSAQAAAPTAAAAAAAAASTSSSSKQSGEGEKPKKRPNKRSGDKQAFLYVVHRPGYATSMVQSLYETGVTNDLAHSILGACNVDEDEATVEAIERIIVTALAGAFEEFKAGDILNIMSTALYNRQA